MRSRVAILYSLARSGGTIISRCVASIPGNVLLSEVHPRWAFFDPVDQACEWFGLITDAERRELRARTDLDYVRRIQLIQSRCADRGLHLIIRDWTHVDFFHAPNAVEPDFRLSQYEYLKEQFDISHIAIIRHPLDTWLSLRQIPPYREMPLSYFLPRFRLFAEIAAKTGMVRYEDFCDEPRVAVSRICGALGVNYSEEFLDRFAAYTTITGDTLTENQTNAQTGEAAGARASREIRRPARRPEYGKFMSALNDNAMYRDTLATLGYEP
jgi:hypothetical protein